VKEDQKDHQEIQAMMETKVQQEILAQLVLPVL